MENFRHRERCRDVPRGALSYRIAWCPSRTFARALVGKPSVLLADEPTGNLDFRTGEMIFELLAHLHRTHQLTSVFVTHNLSFARRCDRVLSMEKGGLVPGNAIGPHSGAEPGYL